MTQPWHSHNMLNNNQWVTAQVTDSFRKRDFRTLMCVFSESRQMAASPIPHFLQPKFLAARRHLLARLRTAHASGRLEGTVAGELFGR